jgi:hypothetical protein
MSLAGRKGKPGKAKGGIDRISSKKKRQFRWISSNI